MVCLEKYINETPIDELPTHRFYFSVTSMAFDMQRNKRGQKLYSVLYDCINSYYQESLALLRATTKFFRTIYEQEQNFETSYLNKRSRIDTRLLLENREDEEYEEVLRIAASRLLESKNIFYDSLDLEKNLFLSGTIVQFLSLLESTLHSFYKKLIEIDTHLPKIEDVCKRDKGIIKHLKYFERTLITNPKPVLVGTSDYQKLRQWIDFRNNITTNQQKN